MDVVLQRRDLRDSRARSRGAGPDRVVSANRLARCTSATAGSARTATASAGDERCGWEVEREFYVNDTGGQIRFSARAFSPDAAARLCGGGLPGRVRHAVGAAVRGPRTSSKPAVCQRGNSSRTYGRPRELDICFDEWYSQASIEESGQVGETIELFRERGSCTRTTGRSGSGPPRSATPATVC